MSPFQLSCPAARKIWMSAQGLHQKDFFGQGPNAAQKAIEQLGYVQIDTINVIERSHHHILFSRVSDYKKSFLHQLQSVDKSVFEYWTHALSYIPTKDYSYFISRMKRVQKQPGTWLGEVLPNEMKKVVAMMKKTGPVSIRDIVDDVLVEKNHLWASRKPSKKALEYGFHTGKFTVSERIGMLKKYDLAQDHFQWKQKPKAATRKQEMAYLLQRALNAQGVVSLESICYLKPSMKKEMHQYIEAQVRRGLLVEVVISGLEKIRFWSRLPTVQERSDFDSERVHILSPFDPLVIQRRRLAQFFDYDHRFEAYLPREKRVFGYFALPILIGDRVVAVIDFKTDRQQQKLCIQKWTWRPGQSSKANKISLESAIHAFETFQLNL